MKNSCKNTDVNINWHIDPHYRWIRSSNTIQLSDIILKRTVQWKKSRACATSLDFY